MHTNRYPLIHPDVRTRAAGCLAAMAKRMFAESEIDALKGRTILVHKFRFVGEQGYSLLVEHPHHVHEKVPFENAPKNLLIHHPNETGLAHVEPEIIRIDDVAREGVFVFSSFDRHGADLARKHAGLLCDMHGKPFKAESEGTITLLSPTNDGKSVTLFVTHVEPR